MQHISIENMRFSQSQTIRLAQQSTSPLNKIKIGHNIF